MENFALLDSLKKKPFIADLPLCTVLMEDKEFPWILLIPRRSNVVQINQLTEEDQIQLVREINVSSNIMEKLFVTDRLNVAAIGNKTPQLHIHIISRTQNDSLWPETVWGQKMEILQERNLIERREKLINSFAQESIKFFQRD
jgi:diadenosine tetraphosphate (Ap4A) HIT family hydrolase